MPYAFNDIMPEDHWVLVGTAFNFARVDAFPHNHPVFVATTATGSGPPSNTTVGFLVEKTKKFWIRGAATEDLYVRTSTPAPDTLTHDGRVRVDVYVS